MDSIPITRQYRAMAIEKPAIGGIRVALLSRRGETKGESQRQKIGGCERDAVSVSLKTRLKLLAKQGLCIRDIAQS